MDWWNKMVFRFRRGRYAVDVAGVKSRGQGEGILKLHDDIQSCGYEDIQVMWEMLRRSDSDTTLSNQSPRKSLNRELSHNRPNIGCK